MSEEEKLQAEIKRQDYWARDEPSKSPTRRIKQPNEIMLDDIIMTSYGDYLNTIRTEYHD
tara:strand:- start:192 stop:371 length:180 start_codon:yes stop_codon:yes gene_type:complete